jgi:hypothetical protein
MLLPQRLLEVVAGVKGFLPENEAIALMAAAASAETGVWLEIGTYCGKSTVYLGYVASQHDSHLITIDHHQGSEENQPGWEWHDTELVNCETGRLDTLPALRRTLWLSGLETVVTPVVADTRSVATWFQTPLTFLFLDGNHTEDVAPHLVIGGTLAVHDIFEDPAKGGQPPWHVVQRALASGEFVQTAQCDSLRVLKRVARS